MPKKKNKTAVPIEQRFVEISDNELQHLMDELDNKNTKKAGKKCEKQWLNYLSTEENVPDGDYWLWDEETLNYWLSKYWFEVRTQEGDRYRVSSLEHTHYGMKRLLQRKGHAYGITKSESFSESQKAYQKACKQLKTLGYRYVESYKEENPKASISNA